MKNKMLLRVILLLAGLTVAHFGVTLFILSDLGSDPFNVLVQGIFRFLTDELSMSFFTHGTLHIVICLLIIAVLLVVDKSYIKIGTLLCMICGGPIIDVFSYILKPLFALISSLWLKIPIIALGCVILAFGMTIVIKSDAGTGPNDLVAVVISEKSKKKFGVVRIITDALFVAVGFLLGGSVGIGTVICAFLVGPVAGVFMPVSKRIVERILKTTD